MIASRSCFSLLRGAALVAAFAILAFAPRARAQQQQGGVPSLVIPSRQGSANTTLELPANQRGPQTTIPQNVPQTGDTAVIPSRQLREQPGYEQVTVTVTDPSGRYVTGLQKGDFSLYLDGQQRPIDFFRQDLNTPVSVGILVDTSGSMLPKLRQARSAIAEFLYDLNDKDDVFLFAFSSRPYLLQPFTTDHKEVMQKLSLLRADGETALFDTILSGMRMVEHGRNDKKAILVVTDGMDNTSNSNVEDVVNAARRAGVLVYSIGIGNPNAKGGLSISIGPFPLAIGGGGEEVDAATLHTLSDETGAKSFVIREIGDGEEMRKACLQISLELREQYTVGFVAPSPGSRGYRSVRVDVPTHTDSAVRVRKGVDVGEGGGADYSSATP